MIRNIKKSMSERQFWTEGHGSLFLAILVALTIRWLIFEAFVIPSGSMLPTLLKHDHIFVNKMAYGVRFPFSKKWMIQFSGPQRGEVAVFRNPENQIFYIKRVVGLPGDKIYYEKGNLYINDDLVEKSVPDENKADWDWLRPSDFEMHGPEALSMYVHWEENLGKYHYSVLLPKYVMEGEYGPYTVPAGHYFVMGDNRNNSQDSRLMKPEYRFIPFENFVGKAMFVWLSCDETFDLVPICNPLTIRFNRFFHSIH